MKTRAIDWVFLALLFYILADVADPLRHPDRLGMTAHTYYNIWAVVCICAAAYKRTGELDQK